MSKSKESVWFLRHEDYGVAIVRAEDYEQATVKAAAFWDAPWAKIFWRIETDKVMPLHNNICARCGKMFQGGAAEKQCLCDACKLKQRRENELIRYRRVKCAEAKRKAERA